MRNKFILWTLVALTALQQVNAQRVAPTNKMRSPGKTSTYSKKLFEHDEKNFVADLFDGKEEVPTKDILRRHEKSPNTVVFDESIAPEEIFDYINNPDKFFFENGKAYIIANDKARFLTEVELINKDKNPFQPRQLRQEVEKFSDECIAIGKDLDVLGVDFDYPNTRCAIFAFKYFYDNKTIVHQRLNFCTVKVFWKYLLDHCSLNSAICYQASVTGK